MIDIKKYYGFRFGFLTGFIFTIALPKRMFIKIAENYYNLTENDDKN